MKAKDFIPSSKPRNFVAKNQKTAGAGAHKDKKRAEKQGDVKHKNKQFEHSVAEGSSDKLELKIKQLGQMFVNATEPDDQYYAFSQLRKLGGDIRFGSSQRDATLHYPGLLPDEGIPLKKQGVAEVSKATIDRYVAKASDSHGDADFKARMSKHDPDKRSYHVDQKKTAEKRRQGKIGRAHV